MKDAAEKALDDIATICGCPQWEYPGQVVRDVKSLADQLPSKEERSLLDAAMQYKRDIQMGKDPIDARNRLCDLALDLP